MISVITSQQACIFDLPIRFCSSLMTSGGGGPASRGGGLVGGASGGASGGGGGATGVGGGGATGVVPLEPLKSVVVVPRHHFHFFLNFLSPVRTLKCITLVSSCMSTPIPNAVVTEVCII